METNEINLTPLERAVESLKRAVDQPKDEFTRDACIQRFEYTYELSWKLLKRYLSSEYQILDKSIKDIFREAARHELIDDIELWFNYHKARNLTSHTYNEDTAESAYNTTLKFVVSAEALLNTFKTILEDAD